ncbi:MAG: hypothetical protein PHQ01_02115 [Candidatus Pacebacteria bacterium]|nr:hypothetical protein [Candidatus Paceibacterota bacterium]
MGRLRDASRTLDWDEINTEKFLNYFIIVRSMHISDESEEIRFKE